MLKKEAVEQLGKMQKEMDRLKKIIDKTDIVYPEGLIKPEKGDEYFVLATNSTDSWIYDDDSDDKNTACCGNIYSTREAVEKADERRKLATCIKRYIAEINHEADWVCDWKDEDQWKSFPNLFSHRTKTLSIDEWTYAQGAETEWYTYEGGWPKVREKFTDEEIAFAIWNIQIEDHSLGCS